MIFEDDEDRIRFIRKLQTACQANGIAILAWCLMGNHYHLVVRGSIDGVSRLMSQVNTSLAHWYNGRYGHVGPVFQGRFSSTPVQEEAHLLDAICYVHLNPRDRGNVNYKDYRWSSYRQYVGEPGICDTRFVMDVFGGKGEFEAFHELGIGGYCPLEEVFHRRHLSDAEIREMASEAYGPEFGDKIAEMEKAERNRALKQLYDSGASVRQLERLTGIGRGIIQVAARPS